MHGPALRAHYLHGYHGIVPPIALIAPFTRVARSANRSTRYHGDHRMPATERYRRQGLDLPGLRQAGNVVDLDYQPFFIDRVEDAVPPGPQAPQVRRPVRERLRRSRLTGELADSVPERRDTDGILAEEVRRLVKSLNLPVDLTGMACPLSAGGRAEGNRQQSFGQKSGATGSEPSTGTCAG